VVFFDDDVVPRPDAIDRLVNSLDGADAVGATIRPLETGSLIAQYMDLDGMLRHRVADGEVLWVTAAATAFRRSALERVGGFDLGFRPAGEDVDLASRMLESGGTLRVEPTAIVGIGCPSRPWQLMRTLFMYGGGYRMLAARHAGFKKERTRSAMLRLDPREWRNLYRAYRQEASIRRSLAFLLLHAFVVIPYALGVVVGQRVTKGRERNHHVELVLEGRPVEILGHSQRTAAVEDSVEQTSLAG